MLVPDSLEVVARFDRAPGADLHAEPAQHADVGFERLRGCRHRASGAVAALEHDAPVTVPREEVRGGKTGRARADDGDALPRQRECRRGERIRAGEAGRTSRAQPCLRGSALQPADVDGRVDAPPPARLPAGGGADDGQRPRERQPIHDPRESRTKVAGRDPPDRPGDVGVRGARAGARGLAVPVVLGEQHLDRPASCGGHPLAAGPHPVAVGGLRGARRHQAARALVLHEADHARGVVGQPLAEAERRDGDAEHSGGVEQGRTVGYADCAAVHEELRHRRSPRRPLPGRSGCRACRHLGPVDDVDGFRGAHLPAVAAPDAAGLVDRVPLVRRRGNGGRRAALRAPGAADALLVDPVRDERLAATGGAPAPEVILVLAAEVPQRRQHRVRRGPAEAAEAPLLHGHGQLFEQLDVAGLRGSGAEAGQDPVHPLGADPARAARAAGLAPGEVHEVAGDVDHAVGLVEHDHAARPHHGARFREALVVHGQVGEMLRDAPARRPADLHGLEAPAPLHAPADLFDDAPDRHAHRHLDQASAEDLAGQGEGLGSRAARRADGPEGLRAVRDDPRHRGQRLHVVHERRPSPQPRRRRVRRPGPGHAAPALDRGDHRRLLAADESSRALRDLQLEAAEDAPVPAEPDRLADPADRERVLRADEEDPAVGTHREGGDRQALDHPEGVRLQDQPVHERARGRPRPRCRSPSSRSRERPGCPPTSGRSGNRPRPFPGGRSPARGRSLPPGSTPPGTGAAPRTRPRR